MIQADNYLDGLKAYNEKEYSKSFQYLKSLTTNTNAQGLLASMYRQGKGVEKNTTKAIEIYKQLANNDVILAQNILGSLYKSGVDTKVNYTKAIKFFKMAAKQGDAKALFQLGTLYYAGKGVTQDINRAITFYKKSAEKGNKEAQFNLGNIYREGKNTPKDYTKAFQYYRESAKQNFTPAQFNLARMYKEGIGTKKSYKKAFELFKQLSDKGIPNAQYHLGNMYYNGYGIEKNYKKAIKFWEKASQQKCFKAKKSLKLFYEKNPKFQDKEENFINSLQLFYKNHKKLMDSKNFTLKNLDNNQSIEILKNDIKKLLSQYQEIDNLFPSALFSKETNQNDSPANAWLRFVNTSFIYLDSNNNMNLKQSIFEKHLDNANTLMKNSNTFLEYMIALAVYEKVYKNANFKNTILKKYQPLNENIFTIKLKNEEKNILQTVKMLGISFLQKNKINPSLYEQSLKIIVNSAKEYNTKYFKKIRGAIKKRSAKSIKEIEKLLEKDENKFLTSKKDPNLVVGKLFVILVINPRSYFKAYTLHQKLQKSYKSLIKK